MMFRLAFVAAFCVFVAGPVIAQPAQSEAQVLAEAFNKGDIAALANMYSEDAYSLPPAAESVRGRSAIQQFWKSASERMRDLKLTTQDGKNLGSDAIREIGTYSAKAKDQQRRDHGKVRDDLAKGWKRMESHHRYLDVG